jgi:two-component system sensor histidine kinase YesM
MDTFRSIDLKRKILLIISFTVLVVILFCFFVFRYASAARIRWEKEQNLRHYFTQSREQLEAYMGQIDFLAYTVMFSSWVQQFVRYNFVTMTEWHLYRTNVQRFLYNLASVNEDISMVLITDRETVYSNISLRYDSQYSIYDEPWFPELLKNKKYVEYGKSRLFSDLGDEWSLTQYYTVTNINNFEVIGYFVINIPIEKFSFLISESQYDYIELVTADGRLVLGEPSGFFMAESKHPFPGAGAPGALKPGGQDWISYTDTLMDGQWTVTLFRYRMNDPFEDLENYYLVFLLLIPIMGIFAVIILLFSRYLTNPIVRCRNAMQEIRNNNFGITLQNHYRDEIGGLIEGFNEMSLTLVTLRQKNSEIEKLRRDAEIEILQQKMNPHFLYNTLEIINALIMDGQNDDAIRVCELLGQIYHYNLMNNKWVRLRDECEYVKRYLNIIMYGIGNLSVVWETDDEALETDFLKLILQPLVENAVLHGLRSKPADACLTISVASLGDKTKILIMDNGRGIRNLGSVEETLASVRRGVVLDGPHLGIPNVYQRLYLEYGRALEFSIESRPDYGTKVVIVVPGQYRPSGRSLFSG